MVNINAGKIALVFFVISFSILLGSILKSSEISVRIGSKPHVLLRIELQHKYDQQL